MASDTKRQFSIKLFAGFELSVELSIQLKDSREWKQDVVSNSTGLKTIRFKNKDYIGTYIEHEMITTKELLMQLEEMKEKISTYCPNYRLDKLKTAIFPQLLIY